MADQVRSYYQGYNEDTRLIRDNAHRLEWITTTRTLQRYLTAGNRVLDLGAATGAYSLHYGRLGHPVVAVDLVPQHVCTLEGRVADEHLVNVKCLHADARNLDALPAESFDLVLCLGPIYHLEAEEDRRQCIGECCRVLVLGGYLAVAYVSDNAAQALAGSAKAKPEPDPFVLDDRDKLEMFLRRFPLKVEDHVATDGLAISMASVVNALDTEEFAAWVRFHLETCRGPAAFRHAFHGLIVCSKAGS